MTGVLSPDCMSLDLRGHAGLAVSVQQKKKAFVCVYTLGRPSGEPEIMTIEAQSHILEQRRSFFLSLSLCYFLRPYIIDLTTDKICFPQYSTSEEIAILLLQKKRSE